MKAFVFMLLIVRVASQISKTEKIFLDKFHQNDYSVKAERMELIRYNKELVNHLEVHYFKYNRTCTAFNITMNLKVDVGNDFQAVVQAYKWASNEFRLFPIRFQIDGCKAFDSNIYGIGRFTKCGNFNGCPLEKGKTYQVCNFVPDEKHLPPFIPTGSYKAEMQLLHDSKELYVIAGYARVIRPEVKN